MIQYPFAQRSLFSFQRRWFPAQPQAWETQMPRSFRQWSMVLTCHHLKASSSESFLSDDQRLEFTHRMVKMPWYRCTMYYQISTSRKLPFGINIASEWLSLKCCSTGGDISRWRPILFPGSNSTELDHDVFRKPLSLSFSNAAGTCERLQSSFQGTAWIFSHMLGIERWQEWDMINMKVHRTILRAEFDTDA